MKTQNKSILVTGGGSGIGYAIAKAFAGNGNKLILVGRTEERLKTAAASLPNTTYIVADITNETAVAQLAEKIKALGGLDILVNNAGTGVAYQLLQGEPVVQNARYEMEINYFSVLNVIEQFLPVLKESKEAAIINIQSVVSYLPSLVLPTYSPTKAALHSYSQSLRVALQRSAPQIQVYEVFPPLVDTDLVKDFDSPKLSPQVVANDILKSVQENNFNVRSGLTNDIYQLYRQSPDQALAALNSLEA